MDVQHAYETVESILNAANVPGVPQVDVFVGEPEPRVDGDGLVHPYLAIWPGPGELDSEDETLEGAFGRRDLSFQITAAGGDVNRAMRAVTRVQFALVGVRLDDSTGPVRENGDAGPVRKDTTETPVRWFVPLLLVVAL